MLSLLRNNMLIDEITDKIIRLVIASLKMSLQITTLPVNEFPFIQNFIQFTLSYVVFLIRHNNLVVMCLLTVICI